jgi:hypothetical protein
METLVKADIFFFISSVATVVLTVLISVLLFYLIRAGKTLSTLSETLKGDLKNSEEFIVEIKERLENNLVFRFLFPPLRRARRVVTKEESKKDSR